ncbi:MAG: hypothetical protein IPH58_03660 [Sphingobacteriales bacterium]|jgi:hypothetical protein|nr:hypothetical protein [Sphingobacteriales bacterium]
MKTKIFTTTRVFALGVISLVIVGFSSCAPAYYPYDDYYGYYPNYYYSPGYYGYNYYYPRVRHSVFVNRRYETRRYNARRSNTNPRVFRNDSRSNIRTPQRSAPSIRNVVPPRGSGNIGRSGRSSSSARGR